MKYKKNIVILILLIIISINTISLAAIEIKAGTSPYTDINVSGAYQICYDLRANDTTLGNNDLDPHLTLNKDWGAMVYLGSSAYGKIRSGNGVATDTDYVYTSTGNKTGVFDRSYAGSKPLYFQTASISEEAKDNSYIKNLFKNKESKYVELLPSEYTLENTKGQALKETSGWYSSEVGKGYSIQIRINMFGYTYSHYSSGYSYNISDGNKYYYVTFRPVIWNK